MQSVLARKQGLALRQGKLQASDEGTQQRFATCVADAFSGAAAEVEGHELLYLGLAGAGHLRVHVLPLTGSLGRSLISRPTVLLMATEHARLGSASQLAISQVYGCTPSEARLVRLLAEGKTLKQSAALMGITYESARAYVKIAFGKVGVHSQAQLVARVVGDMGGLKPTPRKSDVAM
jgi:DNA-binding CsgD family transcriptional regulator